MISLIIVKWVRIYRKILKMLIVLKKYILMDNNNILYNSFTLLSCWNNNKYTCELDILLTFHYMIFKSEFELYIKWTQLW